MLRSHRLTLLVLVPLGFGTAQQSGWRWQNPLPDGEYNLAVDFIDDSTGYAVGVFGKIAKTTDGGITWSRQSCGTHRNLSGVDFMSRDTGIVVGGLGEVYKTIDGGTSWARKSTPVSELLTDATWLSSIEIVAVGNGENIRSTDGGESWTQVPGITGSDLWGVASNHTGRVIAVGWGGIYLSTNRGVTWQFVYSAGQSSLYDVAFADDERAIAVGDMGSIVLSTDAGSTWEAISHQWTDLVLWGVRFASKNVGVATGLAGRILRTTDGGSSWSLISTVDHRVIYDVDFPSPAHGVAVGGSGLVYTTTDSGQHWQDLSHGATWDLHDIDFLDSARGVAAGDRGTILLTTNGGEEWIEQIVPASQDLYRVHMLDADNALAVGWSGFPAVGVVVRTTNGGSWWTFHLLGDGYAPMDIDFAGSTGIMIAARAGELAQNCYVLRSTDMGGQWDLVSTIHWEPLLQPRRIQLVGPSQGYIICDEGGFYATTNGGTQWDRVTSGIDPDGYALNDMHFISPSSGIAVGYNGIFKTTNGGSTWVSKLGGTWGMRMFYGVHFADAQTGFAVGEGSSPYFSLIMKTTDGGETWTDQYPPTANSLREVHLISPKAAYAVGTGGTILKTASGGTVSVPPGRTGLPELFVLCQNYPNPFNPTTTISFSIPHSTYTTLKIYNTLGQEIATLVSDNLNPGIYSRLWNAGGLASGVYYYRLTTGEFTQTKKLLLLR